MAREHEHPRGNIWPVTIYPSGTVEVVFQHLRSRTPFDDAGLRDEFRTRLNTVQGVSIPAAKIELRPGFPLQVLAQADGLDMLAKHLEWFRSLAAPGETLSH
jgi:hypothetical protein